MLRPTKYGLSCLLLVLLLSSPAHAIEDPWFGQDKTKHFGYSALLGGLSSWVALEEDASDREAIVVGLAIVIPLGVAKESYDRNVKETFWSWKDLTWNIIGSLAGSLLAVAAD